MKAPRNSLTALLAIAILATRATAASASIGPLEFTSHFHAYYMEGSRSVTIADMNGDGKSDLICAAGASATIFLGTGTGAFEPIQTFPVQGPYPAAVGDVDGDGHLDLAFADPAAGHVTVFRGDGAGRVDAGTSYAAGTSLRSAAFADLNGDGKLDLVVSNQTGLAIRLGTGSGSFGAESDVPITGAPGLVVSGDLNDDGIPDLVVGGPTLSTLIGNGDGSFHAGPSVPVGTAQFALSDVSGDGQLDVVAPGDSVSVWYGAGDGTFPTHIKLPCTRSWAFQCVAVGDLDRDGNPDIAAVNPGGDYWAFGPPNYRISIYRGRGQGSFAPEAKILAALAPNFVTAGDLNGDGACDLVVDDVESRVVSVHMSHGDGTFGNARELATSTGGSRAVQAADFDRDGEVDLAAVDGSTLSILRGRGDGGFDPPTTAALGSDALIVKSADMNEDGCPDLVVSRADGGIQTLVGGCDGTFQARAPSRLASTPAAFEIADFDGDDVPDVLVSYGGTIAVLLDTGDGSLGSARVIDEYALGASSLATGDFNGDGNVDIAYVRGAASPFGYEVRVRLGRGDGTFGEPKTLSFAGSYDRFVLTAGDLNHDGRADLVAVDYWRSGTVFLSRGDGTFLPQPNFGVPTGPSAPYLIDVDGDGALDLVVVCYWSNVTAIFRGRGDGSFESPVSFESGEFAYGAAFGDFDDDGRVDAAVANQPGEIAVLLNRTVGASPLPARAFLSNPSALVVGAGPAEVCVNVEPIGLAFSRADVGSARPVLRSSGTGSVDKITGYLLAPGPASDADGNGTPDFPVCFGRDDLARLFDRVTGRGTVETSLRLTLLDGRTFYATVSFTLARAGGPLHATLFPNPTNPFSVLSFATTAAGWIRVELFDARGRIVRVENDRPAAGYHAYVLGGENGSGGRIASGVYFVRIRTEHDGEQRLRFVMLR